MSELYTPTGVKTMLMGPSGSGKTHALATYLDAGITPFILFTENSMATITEVAGEPPDCKIHWRYIRPATTDWSALIDNAKKVRDYATDALQKMPGMNKRAYAQIIDVLQACNNFVCDRCGEEFGDIMTWNTDRAFCLDSLTGLNRLEMALQVGGKPIRSQPDWGVAMDNQLAHLATIIGVKCHFTLTAHIERIVNEVSGGLLIVPLALGKKNGPQIPVEFDEVILAVREGRDFRWSTSAASTDLKARLLPIEENIPPTFETVINAWKAAGGKILPTTDKESNDS